MIQGETTTSKNKSSLKQYLQKKDKISLRFPLNMQVSLGSHKSIQNIVIQSNSSSNAHVNHNITQYLISINM